MSPCRGMEWGSDGSGCCWARRLIGTRAHVRVTRTDYRHQWEEVWMQERRDVWRWWNRMTKKKILTRTRVWVRVWWRATRPSGDLGGFVGMSTIIHLAASRTDVLMPPGDTALQCIASIEVVTWDGWLIHGHDFLWGGRRGLDLPVREKMFTSKL